MERVEANGDWSLFCPHGSTRAWPIVGASLSLKNLYKKYEKEGRARKNHQSAGVVEVCHTFDAQVETGTPYLLYKDAANGKSNQQNLGTIKSSNLCTGNY